MYFTPIMPTDLSGNIDTELLLLAEKVCIKSAALKGSHNFQVIEGLKELLRITNSYYSNKIESEGTHPIDIDKAMKKDFSSDLRKKNLQMLSLSYIEVQKQVEKYCSVPQNSPFSQDFILNVHKDFYTKNGMKTFLKIKKGDKLIEFAPGELRKENVSVGKHIAPKYDKLQSIINMYENLYKIPATSTQAIKLIYALSSHHRLVWIHPFLDGNGRVSRLILDGVFIHIGLEGYGLWNISRGLARDSDEYKKMLSMADMPAQGSLDGRGVLSQRGLKYYIKFMLEIALDQIEYISKHLKLDSLSSKIERYVLLSQQNLLDTQPLPKYTTTLFKELLISGKIARGKVKDIINKQDRTATTLIKKLIEMDYIESDTPKSAIRLKFNSHFASYLIPELFPAK